MRSQKSISLFTVCSATDQNRAELAANIARRMVDMEYQGFGDSEGALRRLSSRTGIGYSTWRNWWHGKKGGVLSSTWEKLVHAYQVECARQAHLFQKELEQAKRLSARNNEAVIVRAAIAIAGDAINHANDGRGDMSSIDGNGELSSIRDAAPASKRELTKLKLRLNGHRGV